METSLQPSQQSDTLIGLSGRRPKSVCESLELSDAARDCLAKDPSPADFLRALLKGGHDRDALHYLAHALPRRSAVRWACACVSSARSGTFSPAAEAALRAALRWAETPDAAACSAAALAAEQPGLQDDGAARFAALAAAWSGESLAPEDQPRVPPPVAIGAAAAAAAVLMAAANAGSAAHGRQRDFISQGILAAQYGHDD